MDGPRVSAEVVSRACAERIDELVGWLGLAPLHKAGNVFTPLNPTRGDRTPGSFVIYGRGHAKQGGWVEYACPPAPGSKAPSLAGDALDLIAYIQTGNSRDRKEGYRAALRFLGWEGSGALDLPHQVKARRALERDRELAAKAVAEERAKQRRDAFERWANRDEKIAIDGPVWRYLAGRGINLHSFIADKRRPNALKQRNEAWHGETQRKFVAMSSLISSPASDGAYGVHLTFLEQQGEAWVKAKIDPPRKIWPAGFLGGAIRLAKGLNKCSPEEAVRNGLTGEVLAIGEGVETMLSVALVNPHWRVWAAGTVGAIGNVVVPASVSLVVLVGENDDNPQARAAFERSLRAQAEQAKAKGYQLYVTRPRPGDDDFNTTLQKLGEQVA